MSNHAVCLWFTGLSGAGKTTFARGLQLRRPSVTVLDGDDLRHVLSPKLGFSIEERTEHVHRVARLADLLVRQGRDVAVAMISPLRVHRQYARTVLPEGAFFEVWVDTPIEVCEERDPKGLYARARAGKIPNFTGISSPYEEPEEPEAIIRAGNIAREQLTELIEEIWGP